MSTRSHHSTKCCPKRKCCPALKGCITCQRKPSRKVIQELGLAEPEHARPLSTRMPSREMPVIEYLNVSPARVPSVDRVTEAVVVEDSAGREILVEQSASGQISTKPLSRAQASALGALDAGAPVVVSPKAVAQVVSQSRAAESIPVNLADYTNYKQITEATTFG